MPGTVIRNQSMHWETA